MASDRTRRRTRRPPIPLELLAAALHWSGLWALLILAWALSA
jgi:hypothetical protein